MATKLPPLRILLKKKKKKILIELLLSLPLQKITACVENVPWSAAVNQQMGMILISWFPFYGGIA